MNMDTELDATIRFRTSLFFSPEVVLSTSYTMRIDVFVKGIKHGESVTLPSVTTSADPTILPSLAAVSLYPILCVLSFS